MAEASSALLSVSVVFSPGARAMQECPLELPQGACVQDALRASGLLDSLDPALLETLTLGVWGRKVSAAQPLREGDRIEIYRPLRVDPKLARRQRFQKQGARAAGLFARRRANAKPGY